MSKKLAIIGHPTRGNEVIKLLEMMGGKNCYNLSGLFTDYGYYFIGGPHNVEIRGEEYIFGNEDICCFTLEEFWEKYPFKVGDKVYIYVQNDDIDGRYDVEVAEIDSMRWNPVRCKIAYKMKNINREFYKEEIKCKVDDNHTKPSKMKNTIAEFLEHIKNTSKKELEKEFNEFEEWTNVGLTVEEFMDFCNKINKKTIYPKTYVECKKMLPENVYYGYSSFMTLQKLIICRDVYWKIYGEQMGLGKPWEPDWSTSEPKYVLARTCNGIEKQWKTTYCKTFVFPTAEMRDAFYENFKDLIEKCKELL